MDIEPKVYDVSCVLAGNLNPAIFHPEWYRKLDIFRDEEIKNAELKFIHPDLSSFNISEISVLVDPNKFTAIVSNESKFAQLRDMVLATFGVLDATPIIAAGINIRAHYEMTDEIWVKLSEKLSPKKNWENLLDTFDLQSISQQGKNPFYENGYTKVTVQPSSKEGSRIFLDINNHFSNAESRRVDLLLKVINSEWDKVINNSFKLMKAILESEK